MLGLHFAHLKKMYQFFGRKWCLILRLFRRKGIISATGHNMAYRLW